MLTGIKYCNSKTKHRIWTHLMMTWKLGIWWLLLINKFTINILLSKTLHVYCDKLISQLMTTALLTDIMYFGCFYFCSHVPECDSNADISQLCISKTKHAQNMQWADQQLSLYVTKWLQGVIYVSLTQDWWMLLLPYSTEMSLFPCKTLQPSHLFLKSRLTSLI